MTLDAINKISSYLTSMGTDGSMAKSQALALLGQYSTRLAAMNAIDDSVVLLVLLLLVTLPLVFSLTPKKVKAAQEWQEINS
jgi:hypothetical protein